MSESSPGIARNVSRNAERKGIWMNSLHFYIYLPRDMLFCCAIALFRQNALMITL